METPQVKYLKDYKAPAYLVDTITLEVVLEDKYTTVTSTMNIFQNPDTSDVSPPLILDGREIDLVDISLDGRPLQPDAYNVESDRLIIHGVPSEFTLCTVTRLRPHENTSLEGLYQSGSMYCTQCEAMGFRKITYYPDRPDVMAVFTCRIVADKKKYPILLSNGNCLERGELDKKRHFVTWHDPYRKPSYLFALVAGDLVCIKDTFTTASGRNVALEIYVEPENADKCTHAMQSLKKAMTWDEEVYGREYDLDIYMIVAVNDFNMGAMENKGLNIFNSKYVLAKPDTATDIDFINIEAVIAHEYFHNWTGNRVTLKNWFQLSLKEGLTVFRDQTFSADMSSAAVKRISDVRKLRQYQFPEDAGPMAHPVRPESYIQMNNFYTQTVYSKGAEVIRMMHCITGKKGFRKGMDLYFERHDGKAVTTDDFVAAMEDANNLDLKQFRLWYSQAGTPQIVIDGDYNPEKKCYRFTATQTCPPTPDKSEKEPMHIPMAMGLVSENGEEIKLQMKGEASTGQTTRIVDLKERTQTFEFINVEKRSIPSFFRTFSAPVKVAFPYTDQDLIFLFEHDPDPFNRWDAGQKLIQKTLLKLIEDYQNQMPLAIDDTLVEAFRKVLIHPDLDKSLIAQSLFLPSESELGDAIADMNGSIDPDAIHTVRTWVYKTLVKTLKTEFLKTFSANLTTEPYTIDAPSIAKRSLKNVCLEYLGYLETEESIQMAFDAFSNATNMTDEVAALNVLVNIDCNQRQEALTRFYDRWRTDTLVIEKWFALQAGSRLPNTLDTVLKLMQHPDFSIKNPNKVRSLIGVFCMANPCNFHQASGDGYLFIADRVLELNALNPQIAARMVSVFNQWRHYTQDRQQMMQKQLERIMRTESLSSDVFEIVTRALKNEPAVSEEI